jgi:penicillin-binding protein 2
MHRQFFRRIRKRLSRRYGDINPEDIFLDSANLPGYTEHRFEGRIERPVGQHTFLIVKLVLVLMVSVLAFKLWSLEVKDGAIYAQISENNRLSQTVIFANRGVIYDRNDVELAGNAIKGDESDFAARTYTPYRGLAHVVGYVKYPLADSSGNYYEFDYRGRDGVERMYNHILTGTNGLKLVETDVFGKVTSESVIEGPEDGKPVKLAVDARVSNELYRLLDNARTERGFVGGAAVIMDVRTGEIISLVSAPEYDQNLITDGRNASAINAALGHSSKPFLNRVVGGLYSPGSIVKPIIALGALNEGLISPEKKIYSSGSISIPNPYNPSNPSIFGDWKAHGWTNMREALAVSSDVYFYSIGGGYGDQKGLGIERIDRYLSLFGLTEKTGIDLQGEMAGTIPTPEWKKATFDGDIWRLGDTFITAIGQYGTLVTPIEAVRFVSAIANGGNMLVPSVMYGGVPVPKERISRVIEFSSNDWQIVRLGMRDCVTFGTCTAVNVPYVKVAAKTGTAEVGAAKKYVHSWSVGYFPFENPRYAFVIILERGPSTNTIGATTIMRGLLDWMHMNAPEYIE